MLKIDNSLLVEIGLDSLPEAEKNSFLKHVYETLEMRVGIRLADQMTNEQLDEFEQYFEAKDDAGAFKWLETNFPNYKDIVQEEFDKLKSEVAQSAPQILAASQAAAGAGPQPQPMPPAQQESPQRNHCNHINHSIQLLSNHKHSLRNNHQRSSRHTRNHLLKVLTILSIRSSNRPLAQPSKHFADSLTYNTRPYITQRKQELLQPKSDIRHNISPISKGVTYGR